MSAACLAVRVRVSLHLGARVSRLQSSPELCQGCPLAAAAVKRQSAWLQLTSCSLGGAVVTASRGNGGVMNQLAAVVDGGDKQESQPASVAAAFVAVIVELG